MFDQIKFLYYMLRFSKDPTNTQLVFKFTDHLVAMATATDRQAVAKMLMEDERARHLYAMGDQACLYRAYDLGLLERSAPGTLGNEYAKSMRAAGLDPEFFAYNTVKDVESFFILRMRKTHDLYHVVTGFGTDVPGELGLQAFYIAQLPVPTPVAIMVSALLWVIGTKDPTIIKNSMDQIVYGYETGKRAAKLHGVIWENLWDEDVKVIRQQLNIAPYVPYPSSAPDLSASA